MLKYSSCAVFSSSDKNPSADGFSRSLVLYFREVHPVGAGRCKVRAVAIARRIESRLVGKREEKVTCAMHRSAPNADPRSESPLSEGIRVSEGRALLASNPPVLRMRRGVRRGD